MRTMGTFAIIVLLSTSLAAQATKPLHPSAAASGASHDKDAQMWLENANVLTQEIIDDGTANLPKYNDFVMNARLAEAWWKVDQKRARQFLEQSSDIAKDRKSESPVEGFRRGFIAGTVIQIITPLDENRSEEMVDELLTTATRLGPLAKSEEEIRAKAYFTDLIVEKSSSDVKVSNQRRAKLFRALRNLGGPTPCVYLLEGIYRTDAGLGDQLYEETIAMVEQKRAPLSVLIDLLKLSMFPPQEGQKPVAVAASLKENALTDLTHLIGDSLDAGISEENCRPVWNISWLESLLPAETQARIIPVKQRCEQFFAEQDQKEKARGELILELYTKRPDEVLEFAEAQTDVEQRATFKELAIGMLAQSNPERAMKVVNDLTAEEREQMGYLELDRDSLEETAIKNAYGRRDFVSLQHLIDDSPTQARTALRIAKVAIAKDPSYAASLLPTIVNRIGELGLNHSEFYIDAVNFVAKTSRPMAPIVFREAMKGINLGVEEFIRGQTPHPVKGFKRTSFWWQLEPANLPSLLDVIDQRSTRLAIDSLKFPMARASMRLWLLKSELKAYETALKAPNSSAAKSQAN